MTAISMSAAPAGLVSDAFAVGLRASHHVRNARMFDIHCITVAAADPYRQALFWSEVTGWQEDPGDPNYPGDPAGVSGTRAFSWCTGGTARSRPGGAAAAIPSAG